MVSRARCVGRASSGPGDPGVDGCNHTWLEPAPRPGLAYLTHHTLSGYESKNVRCPRCGGIYVEVRDE